jgi:hypothetical protein
VVMNTCSWSWYFGNRTIDMHEYRIVCFPGESIWASWLSCTD